MTVQHHTEPPDHDVLTSTVVLEGCDVDVITVATDKPGFLAACDRYIVRNGAIKWLDNCLSPSEPAVLHRHATDIQSCAAAVLRYTRAEAERAAEQQPATPNDDPDDPCGDCRIEHHCLRCGCCEDWF